MDVRLAILLTLCVVHTGYGQEFSGYNTSNFAGVNTVFFNPSGIAGHHNRWDVNIASVHVSAENSIGNFRLGNYSNLYSKDAILHQYRSRNIASATGYLNLNVHGPSVLIKLNERSSVAFTTRARLMVNARNINGKLIDGIMSSESNPTSLPHTFSHYDPMTISSNGWGEIGLSYATIVKDDDMHQLKLGATIRYLGGMVNTYLQTRDLRGTIAHDPVRNESYLTQTSGTMYTGYGGVRLGNFEPSFLFDYGSHGAGGDIGLTYINEPNNDAFYADSWWGASEPLYKFKIGVAITDIGMIRFRRNDGNQFNVDINATERFYTNELRSLQLNYETYFENRPQYFIPQSWQRRGAYNVVLPAMLRADADYHLGGAAYLNIMGQMSLVNNDNSPWGQHGYHSITVTPRIENRFWGVYLPINYNELSRFNAGLSLRAGYFFIGSGSLLSAVYQSRRVDVHAGIRFAAPEGNSNSWGWRKKRFGTDCWKD